MKGNVYEQVLFCGSFDFFDMFLNRGMGDGIDQSKF